MTLTCDSLSFSQMTWWSENSKSPPSTISASRSHRQKPGEAGELVLFVTWRNSPARKPRRGQESQHFPWVHTHTDTHTQTHTHLPHPICTHKGETIHCGGEDSRGEADTRKREITIEGDRTEKGTTHRWRRTLVVGKEILFSSFKRIIQTTESFKKP